MAKVSLSIDKNYCGTWGVWEGIRELITNAKDADDNGNSMEVEHFPRTSRLVITSKNIYVDPAKLLILGKTDKVPGEHRGMFGEGAVLGFLALTRKGHGVTFRNGRLSWAISFEEPDVGHPFAGNELLTFRSRQLSAQEQDFCVEIAGIPTPVWDVLKKQFLFISAPSAAETFQTDDGTLLLHPEYKGKVFTRGVFVREFQDLACGYDLVHLQLDRDRRFVNEWDLHYTLSRIWRDACTVNPAVASPRIYDMIKAGAAETKNLRYHADAKLLAAMRERFEQEHGDDTVPVRTMAEAKEVESLGGKSAMVNDILKDLLESSGLSLEASKKSLEGQVDARFTPRELSLEERSTLAYLMEVVPEFLVVAFKGTKACCRLIDGNKTVGLDRRLLSEPISAVLRLLVSTEASRKGVDAVEILLRYFERTRVRPMFYPSVDETPASQP